MQQSPGGAGGSKNNQAGSIYADNNSAFGLATGGGAKQSFVLDNQKGSKPTKKKSGGCCK